MVMAMMVITAIALNEHSGKSPDTNTKNMVESKPPA